MMFVYGILVVVVITGIVMWDLNKQQHKKWLAFSECEFGYDPNKYSAYNKCVATIRSCENVEQWWATNKMLTNFDTLYNDIFLRNKLYEIYFDKREELEL